jgi:hypothetical protein
MSIKSSLKILMFAVALACSGRAVALNPQPEPPMYYHGYEFTISRSGPNLWRWEIRRPSIGHPSPVLDSGVIKGGHTKAVTTARGAIDGLSPVPPGKSLRQPHQ